MSNQCFYCDAMITTNDYVHEISFFHNDEEREELLCTACYEEWLEGIKE